MPRLLLLALACSMLAVALLPPAAAPAHPVVLSEERDERGRLVAVTGMEAGRPHVAFERHYFYGDDAAQPGGSADAVTSDCTSKAYRLTPWRWRAPYVAYAEAHVDLFTYSAMAWDNETSAALLGGILAGSGPAGVYDGRNQIAWGDLGATGAIAVTTTWYNRFSGQALESDAQYNTFFPWSTDGAAGTMDVQNIATHELGHAFGLDHPKGKGVGCLTMYAYASDGETQKRTLGVGDVLGIRAAYGG